MPGCLRCGAKTRLIQDYCDKCLDEDRKKEEPYRLEAKRAKERIQIEENNHNVERQNKIRNVVLTTAPCIEGYNVEETLEIITSETVFGMNIFRDLFASITDVFGGRSEASQKVLADARKNCLSELKIAAADLGGNAVIAVDLDYSEISGGGKSMLFLVASGTAVRIVKAQHQHGESGTKI